MPPNLNADLERKVQERTAELRAAVEDLEHFSYSITHDMRAPLRAMQSFATLLLMKPKGSLAEDEREYLRRIATAAKQMDDLILDALAYSQAVRAAAPLGPVDPAALLRDMLMTYPEFQLAKADIQIADPLPPVVANRAGLTQCFSNLLRNAIKFVAPGVMPKVQVSAEVQAGRVRLWFADNGIGIPPEFHGRLFKMFERASSDHEGTGIGLALVRKVTERMGGQVGVESAPGRGSRFWIELKLAGLPRTES